MYCLDQIIILSNLFTKQYDTKYMQLEINWTDFTFQTIFQSISFVLYKNVQYF